MKTVTELMSPLFYSNLTTGEEEALQISSTLSQTLLV